MSDIPWILRDGGLPNRLRDASNGIISMKTDKGDFGLLEDAADEIERLREALEWYGEKARLCRLIHSEGDAGRRALDADGGERARVALGKS